MYRRNTGAPPPGYSGTAFDARPTWPPREEPPREPRRMIGEQPGYAPFASGKRTVPEPDPPPPVVASEPIEKPETDTEKAEKPLATEQTRYPEDTLFLFGILLLLLRGEEGTDLLPLLSMLLFL